MYSEDVKRKLFLITNYKYGFETYDQMGFEIGRGQNLQISCIGKSIYSDDEKPNFYRLVAPTDISEYRTVRQFRYLGNKKALSLLKRGDVIFGAEGFCKGRVVILADGVFLTITNIHGIVFHHKDDNIVNGIFLGCFLGYLRNIGLIDAIGAGGSGGSLAIGYFHHVPFPKFPDEKKTEIARLYHNPAPSPKGSPTLDTFVEWHRNWNKDLGIWELDYEMKALQQTLEAVQKKIISGETISLPFYLETSLSHRPRSVRDFETQLLLPLTSTSH
jgi:type I restriction enzyme S subunit